MPQILLAVIAIVVAGGLAGRADALDSSEGALRVTPMVTGLDQPWAVGFLPGGAVLITERDGRLIHIDGGEITNLRGVPIVADNGQGGLLDVLVPRDFAQTREIFLSYAAPQGRGAGTAVARGILSDDASRLLDVRTIFEMERGMRSDRHFGSRIVEGRDGFLYVSIGDRGDRPSAQDLTTEAGAVVRIARDGSVPADNPFVGQAGAQPEIWSYGHRNPQGMAITPDGVIVTAEHGARGGDEVNILRKGANYGWPVISYGRHYSGASIGEGTERAGMEQPAHYWDPSIAPSGMMVYSGRLWPNWRGDMFVGSLKFDMISRLERGGSVREAERLASDETLRVRDIREGPDGAIWFLSIGNGTLYRMTPG
ncbi:MAG: PQQ-dependent sugar dehydrogenase [Pseudomonadota bacterium]